MLVLWWAAQKVVMGRMRPAGRRLPTPGIEQYRKAILSLSMIMIIIIIVEKQCNINFFSYLSKKLEKGWDIKQKQNSKPNNSCGFSTFVLLSLLLPFSIIMTIELMVLFFLGNGVS